MDSCQNKNTSEAFATANNAGFTNETKKIDTPEASLDNSACSTTTNSSNVDLDAPLSPVLSNSKHSMKYIARKKSRIKLMNKFSQASTASQLNAISRRNSEEFITGNVNCNELSINTNGRPENFSTISGESPKIAARTISIEEERMIRIKELQRNRKFCYRIETIAPISTTVSSNINQYNTVHSARTKNAESNFTCKKHESPIVPNAVHPNKISAHINYEIKHGCPTFVPAAGGEGFSTGAGKKIQLSERALKRAAKIFDDITDLPSSENVFTVIDNRNDTNAGVNKITDIVSEKELRNRMNDASCEKTDDFETVDGKMVSFPEINRNAMKNMLNDILELSLYVENADSTSEPNNAEDGTTPPAISSKSQDSKHNSSPNQSTEHFKFPTRLNKSDKVVDEVSSDDKSIPFTQANDSQMCWVADNAECMVELMDNKWISSPSGAQESNAIIESSELNLHQDIRKNARDFQHNSGEQTDLLLGNLTILDYCNTRENKSSGSQMSVCTNDRIVESSGIEGICRGFSSEEYLESLKVVELYKRAINYIAEDINKGVYYPMSFTFDDVQRSVEYQQKNLRYSLRSRNKPCITYVGKKRRSSRQKQRQETVKRRKSYLGGDENSTARHSTEKTIESGVNHRASSQACRRLSVHEAKTDANKLENMEYISSIFNSSSSDKRIRAHQEAALEFQIHAKFETLISNTSVHPSDTSNKDLKEPISTASGKKVKISENSLSKVQPIFDGCGVLGEENNESLNSYGNVAFSTASGKKVHISKEALEKSKHIFDDCKVLKEESCTDESKCEVRLLEEEVVNKARHIFDDCNRWSKENAISDKTETSNIGFSTAAGKNISISEESFKTVSNVFNDLDVLSAVIVREYETPKKSFGFSTASGKKVNTSVSNNCGFATASGKSVNISEESLRKAENMFDDVGLPTEGKCTLETPQDSLKSKETLYKHTDINDSFEINLNSGFTTAAWKKVEISEEAWKRSKHLFDDYDGMVDSRDQNVLAQNTVGFTSAAGTKINISAQSLQKVKHLFEDCDINREAVDDSDTPKTDTQFGFATASGQEVKLSALALRKAKDIFDKYEPEANENTPKSHTANSHFGFTTASGKNVQVAEESLRKVRSIFDGCEEGMNLEQVEEENSNRPDKILQIAPYSSPVIIDRSAPSDNMTCNEVTPVLRNKALASRSLKKRSLGVSSCRQINISGKSLKKAKLIFEETDTPRVITNINNNFVQKSVTPTSNISPVFNKNVTPSVSTPQNQNISNMTDSIKRSIPLHSSQKSIPERNEHVCNEDLPTSAPFIFKEETGGNMRQWKISLQQEYNRLKVKMAVIETRMKMLDKQGEIVDNRRPIPGHLFQQKTGHSKRISLQEFVDNRRPGKDSYQSCRTMVFKQSLLDISPDNASKLHFNVPSYPNPCRTYPAVIHTEDNAVIVPNQQNFVGVTEVETAFRAMPGVDPHLIPKGWVANHYKWIVWKLASMERTYPDVFTDYLSADTVVSQLKYRYDREIDRAQRPALRKILECDDTAAKRMVLCVSAVIKLTEGKHELELTDGWYSIKTTIDGPLNSLVCSGVIRVGMKLMVQGAELLQSEGCYPLETPANVRLQIHYNSTRRAAWYARLGYQRNPGPLCIGLRTINNNGGPIGLTCAYVTRVYPISFMERLDDTLVWRNRKAEERRANRWESMQAETMERLQSKVQQAVEAKWRNKQRNRNHKIRRTDLEGMHCPKTLYEMLADSHDPDSIREMMTADQYNAVQSYQSRLSMEQQAELNSRLQQMLSLENVKPRNVSSILKLLLLDVNSPLHSRSLSVWRPKDSHLQELKEGNVVRIYSLSARNNGSLSTIPRTQFDLNMDFDTAKFEKFDRRAIPICQTLKSEFKPLYGEFDTAGMIIFMDVQQTNQSLWLADEHFKFLLVRISEGPETCCLLEGLILGNVIAVTNLVHQTLTASYGEALANHCTTISSYPTQSYLQDFTKQFIENLPQDADKYLQECKDQVEIFLAQRLLNSSVLNTFIMDYDVENENKEIKSKTSRVTGQTQQKCDGLTLSDEEMSLIDTQML